MSSDPNDPDLRSARYPTCLTFPEAQLPEKLQYVHFHNTDAERIREHVGAPRTFHPRLARKNCRQGDSGVGMFSSVGARRSGMRNEPLAKRVPPEFIPEMLPFNDLSCRTRVADLTHEHGFLASARPQAGMQGECQSRSIFHSFEEHSARRATRKTTGALVHRRATETRRSSAEQTPDPENS